MRGTNKKPKTYAPGRCGWCVGTGKGSVAPGLFISCIVCGGKGHISLLQPAGECKECEGTGRRNTENFCLICAGTGWGHFPS